MVVSKIFYFYPYLGKWSNLTNIFKMGWNHQLGWNTSFLLGRPSFRSRLLLVSGRVFFTHPILGIRWPFRCWASLEEGGFGHLGTTTTRRCFCSVSWEVWIGRFVGLFVSTNGFHGWCFGARWFGFRSDPRKWMGLLLKGTLRIPNHRAPNHQLTTSGLLVCLFGWWGWVGLVWWWLFVTTSQMLFRCT